MWGGLLLEEIIVVGNLGLQLPVALEEQECVDHWKEGGGIGGWGGVQSKNERRCCFYKNVCCFPLLWGSSMHFGQLHSPLWWGMKKSVPFGSYVELLHFYTRTSFLEDPSGMILIPCELLLKECMCMTFNYHESSALIIWCFWILKVQTYFWKILCFLLSIV